MFFGELLPILTFKVTNMYVTIIKGFGGIFLSVYLVRKLNSLYLYTICIKNVY